MTLKTDLPFYKMQALGNDFIVLDVRDGQALPDQPQMRLLADRRFGVGCDQILVLRPASAEQTVGLDIYNADGSPAGACGNGLRCVARLVLDQANLDKIGIETVAGHLEAWRANNTGEIIGADMGQVFTDWKDIPTARAVDTLGVDMGFDELGPATLVSVGNPHAVFFVEKAEAVDIEHWGPLAERHELFPDRANVEFIEVQDRQNIRMRVWERGVGVTLACGSGACAAVVASIKRGLTDDQVTVHLDGGALQVSWQNGQDNHVVMTGPASYVAKGMVAEAYLTNPPARFTE